MKQKRIEEALRLMKQSGLDAVIYGSGANFQYLLDANDFRWQRQCETNIAGKFTSYLQPEVFLLLCGNGDYQVITNYVHKDYFLKKHPGHVIASYMDQFEDAVAPYIKGKHIGVGISSFDYLKTMLLNIDKDIKVTDAEDLLRDVRCFKDEDEIAALREIAKFTDEACGYVIRNLKEGMTQREAENLLVRYGYMNGIEDRSFPPTVGFKTQNTISAKILEYFDREWKLQKQTGIIFDVGFMNHGYCSDWGRTIYYGKAPDRVKEGYFALQEGQQYMVRNIIPYKTNISELYRMVQKKVIELGFEKELRYQDIEMLGHQIGIDCHEFPMVNKDNDFIIKPGMVFASEPKMWFENETYMRVEDIILITENGAEFLTNFPRDLFEIGG